MKSYDAYALAHVAPIAVITAFAGRSVLPFTPWAAWSMFALSVMATLLTIDILLGWPVITAYANRSWKRRQARKGVQG